MNEAKLEIRVDFVTGLKEVVLNEINRHPNLRVIREGASSLYLGFIHNFAEIKHLRSVSRAYVVVQNGKYHPRYISNHKSILGNLAEIVIHENGSTFKSFKIICAGSNSSEVRSIAKYIQSTYGLALDEEADMKIHIVKLDEIWEIGVEMTARPLSLRGYRAVHMSGAMNPTVAYAVNSLGGLENANSYLNIFSGSATLLIEAGQCYPNLKKLVGFDNNKNNLTLAMQNIKKAGLIRRIGLREEDIFDKPDLGKFDIITSDLPFGMSISKDENLDDLYRCFVEYCERTLRPGGKLIIYTSEDELLERVVLESKFKIVKTLELKLVTAVNSYLRPKIFVCG